jgi:GxxExxY protein
MPLSLGTESTANRFEKTPRVNASARWYNTELNELSERVIGCAFTVINTLGAGFLEKVYENALAFEVRAAGLSAVQQYGAKVYYKDIVVGDYFADLLVNDVLLVELKTVKTLDDAHRAQCTNYLKATGLQLCLLLNFGKPRLEIKRVAHGL